MSFKRTATGLIIISVVTAAAIGVYLWFNFNSRSSLILVVPKNCQWIYHFQTGSIRKITTGDAPPYLDSVTSLLKSFPVFEKVKDPAEPGIKLHSDIVLFGNKHGSFAALTLLSESKFKAFLQNLPKGRFVGNIIENDEFSFVKVQDKNLYIGFKHKAVVFFRPKDTNDNLSIINEGLGSVFSKDADYNASSMKMLQDLYAIDCQVVFYQRSAEIPSHGVKLENLQAKFISAKTGKELLAKTAVAVFDEAAVPGGVPVKKNKTITSTQYLNLAFKTLYVNLKEFSK